MRVAALIPAHDEAECIGATVRALKAQDYGDIPVLVVADNCSDSTARIARTHGAETLELHANRYRKPGALNTAFALIENECDILITVDADTTLPPHAVTDFVAEMQDERVGGIFAKVTCRLPERGRWARLLARLQRIDFAHWVDGTVNTRKRQTSCIGGQGNAFRVTALRRIAQRADRSGPWSYDSITEDFELTYRLREHGWDTRMSATVRAHTDAMTTLTSLWNQRMKWTVGGLQDMRRFGFNRRTWKDWYWQVFTWLAVVNRLVLIAAVTLLATGVVPFMWYWLLPTPVFLAMAVRHATRLPDGDKWDVLLAAVLLPQELWEWLRAGWHVAAWAEVLSGRERDRWALQANAEKGGKS